MDVVLYSSRSFHKFSGVGSSTEAHRDALPPHPRCPAYVHGASDFQVRCPAKVTTSTHSPLIVVASSFCLSTFQQIHFATWEIELKGLKFILSAWFAGIMSGKSCSTDMKEQCILILWPSTDLSLPWQVSPKAQVCENQGTFNFLFFSVLLKHEFLNIYSISIF